MTTKPKNKTAEKFSAHVNAWKIFQWENLDVQRATEEKIARKVRPKNWHYEVHTDSINPAAPYVLWKGKQVLKYATPKNPLHDAAQIAFEKKESAIVTSDFQKSFLAFGWCIYRKLLVKNKMGKDIAYLKNEIAETATSAAINFCATSGALIYSDTKPAPALFWVLEKMELKTWPKEIFVAAYKEVESLLYRMSKTANVPLAYFDFLDAEFSSAETGSVLLLASAEEKKRFVEMRCAELKEKIASEAPEKISVRKSAIVGRAVQWIERAREYAIAAINSESFPLVAPKMFQTENETHMSTVVVMQKSGLIIGTEEGKQTVQRSDRLKRNADARRNARFEKIIGVQLTPKNPAAKSIAEKSYAPVFRTSLTEIIGIKNEKEKLIEAGLINPPEKIPAEKSSEAKWIRKPFQVWTAQLIGSPGQSVFKEAKQKKRV